VIYCTTQTHSLGRKAGLVLGLSVTSLPVYAKDEFGLRGATLEAALAEDLKNGKKPFALSTLIMLHAALKYRSNFVQLLRWEQPRAVQSTMSKKSDVSVRIAIWFVREVRSG
jgi:hypothetical protein